MMQRETPLVGDPSPRTEFSNPTTLHNSAVLNATTTAINSGAVVSDGWREFALLMQLSSSGSPTTIQIIPEFSDDGGTTWYQLLEGVWASMFFEDTLLANTIRRVFTGPVVAGLMRVRIVGSGTTASNTFTATIKVVFRR